MDTDRLSSVSPGDTCIIHTIGLHGAIRDRLIDMGLLPGVELQCAYTAPGGSPIAFWVKGAMIALRASDCRMIGVLSRA